MRTAYSTSKLGVIYLTHALARHLPAGVDVYSFHHGLVPGTGLARDASPITRAMFKAVLPALRVTSKAQSLQGAEPPRRRASKAQGPQRAGEQLAAVATGRVAGPTGSYINQTIAEPSSDASYDEICETDLWQTAAALTGGVSPYR